MNWHWYLTQVLARLTVVVPWLLGGLVGLGVFSFSPLGREVVHRLRSKRDEAALTEATLQELSEVRQLLGEIAERLDVTERRLAQIGADPPRPQPALGQPSAIIQDKPVVTPH
jgi:hypothetical protein